MAEHKHPITPPWALIAKWRKEWTTNTSDRLHQCNYVANHAARWGADQELEACVNYVDNAISGNKARALRAARRPKPPSLAEEALDAQERMWIGGTTDADWELIRRALERLKELEGANG